MRVLIVDDNSDAAETLADLLMLSGFEARWTTSGRGARDLLVSWKPDALVADYLIPDLRCETLIIEARDALPRISVLVWTGSQNDLASLRSNASVNEVVLKPAGAKEIVAWLRHL